MDCFNNFDNIKTQALTTNGTPTKENRLQVQHIIENEDYGESGFNWQYFTKFEDPNETEFQALLGGVTTEIQLTESEKQRLDETEASLHEISDSAKSEMVKRKQPFRESGVDIKHSNVQISNESCGRSSLGPSSDAPLVKKARRGWSKKCSDGSNNQRSVKKRNRMMPSTKLSTLIDKGVLSMGQKASYKKIVGGPALKEGKVTREGIECICCRKVYNLSNFEAHAGSNYHHPAANIFLDDGRSLIQCQGQCINMESSFNDGQCINMDSDLSSPGIQQNNDQSIPSSRECSDEQIQSVELHHKLQLMDSNNKINYCEGYLNNSINPNIQQMEGNKTKSSITSVGSNILGLQCGNYGWGENNDDKHLEHQMILHCDQCNKGYVVDYLKEGGLAKLVSYPEGNWFCRKTCAKKYYAIITELSRLLNQIVGEGMDNENNSCNNNQDSSRKVNQVPLLGT